MPFPWFSLPFSLPSLPSLSSPCQPDQDSSARSPVAPAQALSHYATPGVSPPSARVAAAMTLQEHRPIRFWDLWKYGFVFSSKAIEISLDVLSHYCLGPKRTSWGIEMTVITSFMRGASKHTHLVDINTVRLLMSLAGFVPLPADAIVTPVTFKVKRRGLKGILAEYDAEESGKRELSGEWVVGSRQMWRRLQNEWKQSNSTPSKSTPRKERIIFYIHGGAYYVSSAAAQRLLSIPLSKYTDARVFALDYRLAPETTFPGPLHDVTTGYFRLLEDLHIPPENIIVAGDSAGGGLCLSFLMYLRDNNYPLPAGAILMSPWVDLTMSCESWDLNADVDVVPMPKPDDALNPVHLYLGPLMEKYLTHPYASPLFGDFKGLPPLLIQSGDAEVLRDEITLLAHKASLAGVEVQHELYEDAVHVFQLYPFLESARRSYISMREFVKTVFLAKSPQVLDSAAEEGLEQELENDSTTVVRGDGVKTASGMHDVKQEIATHAHELPDLSSDTDGQSRSSLQRQRSSWIRSPVLTPLNWSTKRTSYFDDSSSDNDTSDTEAPIAFKASSRITRRSTSSVRRKRSETLPAGFTAPVITSSTSSSTCIDRSPSAKGLSGSRRTGSRASLHPPSRRNEPPGRLNTGSLTMSSQQTPPPSPSLRRTSNKTISHPDLTRLVDNWTESGPANVTHHFMHNPTRPRSSTSMSRPAARW